MIKPYSEVECLQKLRSLGYDVPPVVLRTWGKAKFSGSNSHNRRTTVERYIHSITSKKYVRTMILPDFLAPFDVNAPHRPTAWWTREREEKERAEHLF